MDSYINMHKEQLLSWSRVLDSIQTEVLSWQSQKILNHLNLIYIQQIKKKQTKPQKNLLIIKTFAMSSRINKKLVS